jgi:hypothetical protein
MARACDLLKMEQGGLASVDPVKLLWAIAGVESNFGQNSAPRHEQGYCYGGRYFNVLATNDIGCLAHCSYGPWQVMYANFPKLTDPRSLIPFDDGTLSAELSVRAAISVLNRAISRGAKSLAELVIAYNGPRDVEHYEAKLLAAFDRPMPQSQDSVVA